MTEMNAKTTKRVSKLFGQGYAPSMIDRALGLSEGTARGIIVSGWAADSEAAAVPVDTEAILSLFKKSFAPSQIDKRLRLATGTAHDVIVESWAADSRRGKNSRKTEKALDLFGEHRCA